MLSEIDHASDQEMVMKFNHTIGFCWQVVKNTHGKYMSFNTIIYNGGCIHVCKTWMDKSYFKMDHDVSFLLKK